MAPPTGIGTTGERPWTAPARRAGRQPAGHSPPVAPRAIACTVLSLFVAMTPAPPTVGGVVEKSPELNAHFTFPEVSKGRPLFVRGPFPS